MDNIKETMNIYEKMQEARVQLQKLQIKKNTIMVSFYINL